MARILLVEDDDLLRDSVQDVLARAGHDVLSLADGLAAQRLLEQDSVDAVLLDLGLPQMDGMSLLRWIRTRQASLPVMILTARASVDHRVEGLTAGADDYLTKPFDNAELSARVQALLRRARLPSVDEPVVKAQGSADNILTFDNEQPRVWLRGQAVDLTQREWELLRLLHTQREQVVSREAVLQAWQGDDGEPIASNAIEVYVHRLRRKLQGSGLNIRNIRGLGYMLEST
jgi:DNA-binding response OmpR family regulator